MPAFRTAARSTRRPRHSGLRWSKLSGGGEKAYVDGLRICEVQGAALDLMYLEEWVSRLGAADLWERLKGEAEEV